MARVANMLALCRFFGPSLLGMYRDLDDCASQIAEQLKHSNDAAILSIKGRDLSQRPEPFRDILRWRARTHKHTRVLLQSPTSGHIDHVVSRTFHYELEEYKKDLRNSIRRLLHTVGNHPEGIFRVALYDALPVFKLYMFDDEVYLGFYTQIRGNFSHIDIPAAWHLRRQGEPPGLNVVAESHFENLWRQAVLPGTVFDVTAEESVAIKQGDLIGGMAVAACTSLRDNICTCFNDGEIRTLCADMQVDYDDLAGDAKTAKVRELIAYLERRGRLPELIEICHRLRPHVFWKDLA